MSVRFEEKLATPAREEPRGRDILKSSGRGGAGNIHSSNAADKGTYIDSVLAHNVEAQGAGFSGRGGVGNLRSPSKEVPTAPLKHDLKEDAIIQAAEAHAAAPHSGGRGGAGNILHAHGVADNHVSTRPDMPSRMSSRNESGSRSRSRVGRMVGRGGAGNFQPELDGQHADAIMAEDDLEARRARAEAVRGREREAPHSTGRGGAGNLTIIPEPTPEAILTHGAHVGESTGRGGRGNILHHGRSASREPMSPGSDVSTGIPTLDRNGGEMIGSRSVDARGGARSSSRGPASSRERSVEGFLNRIAHPFAPRGGKERTIVE